MIIIITAIIVNTVVKRGRHRPLRHYLRHRRRQRENLASFSVVFRQIELQGGILKTTGEVSRREFPLQRRYPRCAQRPWLLASGANEGCAQQVLASGAKKAYILRKVFISKKITSLRLTPVAPGSRYH